MAVTVTKAKSRPVPGKQRTSVCQVTFDSSYQENGEPLTLKELGYRRLTRNPICTIVNGSESSTLRPPNCWYSRTEEKIHLIDSATGKEVASAANCEKVKVELYIQGY